MKSTKKSKAAIDLQLDYWEKTNKQHTANVVKLEEKHKHDMDWFNLEAYQKMVYGK